MSLSKYILRGKIIEDGPHGAVMGTMIELLAWLDSDAEQMPSDALAKVRRQFAMEIRGKGLHVEWERPFLALPEPEFSPNQLLFSFPGVQVYDLTPRGTPHSTSELR